MKTLGIDERQDSRKRNIALVEKLKMSKEITFQATKIANLELANFDIAIALHACDTASDDAISWAVKSGVEMILVAPCCHHDIQRQMRGSSGRPRPIDSGHFEYLRQCRTGHDREQGILRRTSTGTDFKNPDSASLYH